MIIVSEEMQERLRRSRRFNDWTPLSVDWNSLLVNPRKSAKSTRRIKPKPIVEVIERHYSVSEVARLWGISTDLVRDLFRKEQGVLTFKRPATRTKRGYSIIRVPHSVLTRVHASVSQ